MNLPQLSDGLNGEVPCRSCWDGGSGAVRPGRARPGHAE